MRRNILTILTAGIVLLLLVALNVVFLSPPQSEETEEDGDRSSYRSTPYGTLAYYTLLGESGKQVVRFEEPFTNLTEARVGTLVVVMPKAEYQPTEEEMDALETWVTDGGKLIVLDRKIVLPFSGFRIETAGPLGGAPRPVAVSEITRGVANLAVSDLAATLTVEPATAEVHVVGAGGALVVGTAYAEGYMVFVADPYVVQNNGIRESDNVALALNLVDARGDPGKVAFDEYHQGHGVLGSREEGGGIREYVSGTPVPLILAQLALVAGAVALTAGRRFGRAVPRKHDRRTSALEFVSSMANIQRLARASDLAVENVYSQFRARLCRYAGLPSNTPTARLAQLAGRRAQLREAELLALMNRCEAIIAWQEKVPARELVDLIARIRETEAQLHL